jgi:hypothetical protein
MQLLDLLVHAGADVTIENNARHASALAGPSPGLEGEGERPLPAQNDTEGVDGFPWRCESKLVRGKLVVCASVIPVLACIRGAANAWVPAAISDGVCM